jgi:hypothetical protein
MSDIDEYIADAKASDARFRILADAIAVESDMRDNITIRLLLTALDADSRRAMEELAELSPLDSTAVAFCLVRVRSFVYIRRILDDIIRRGQVARQSIEAEDRRDDTE